MESGKIRIIIADDEQNICEMLRQLIRFEKLGLELVQMCSNGEDLRKAIVEYRPQIVITDIYMPVMDGLEVIRWCNENGYQTNFVVLSGYHQFEYAYNALKYKVNDYLLKPVNEEELNETLMRIVEKIREDIRPKQIDNSAYIHSLHEYFMKRAARETDRGGAEFLNLESINREFMLNLRPGLFRFFYLSVDDRRANKAQDEQVTSVVEKLRDMTEKKLSKCCHEYIGKNQKRGLKYFINYAPEMEGELERDLKNLYEEARAIIDIFSGMHFTMCIGKAVRSPAEIPYAEKCAWSTLFCKFGAGLDRIIWHEQLGDAELEERIKDWSQRLTRAWDALDEKELNNVIQEIFLMPRSVRTAKKYALFVRDIDHIVSLCREDFCRKTGLEFTEDCVESLRPHLNDVNSLEEYRERMIQVYGSQIRECSEMVDRKNLKPIRMACSYVEEHFSESIKLEDVARILNLNPAYFSTLFVKKTGQNFTEYVTLFRLKKACELLAQSDMNVNEIAMSLGFSDVRYFSKLFRKKMGLKPTEYRRIYG